MNAIRNRYPNVLIQFEDFKNECALPILQKYRNRYLCFNDDIQGTGTVTLAGLLSALRAQRLPFHTLTDQRIVCLGAGSAGLGVRPMSHSLEKLVLGGYVNCNMFSSASLGV